MEQDQIENEPAQDVPASASGEPTLDLPAEPQLQSQPLPVAAEPGIPEKFRGPDGQLRADVLLKSYLALERKIGSMLPAPDDPDDPAARDRLLTVLGRPKDPADYQIERRAEWLEQDRELDARLHEAGFTNRQAQLVYDLAAERIAPLVEATLAEVEGLRAAEAARARLAEQFGGSERYAAVAQQLKAFGERHLDRATYETLSRSYDGVMALHAMMRAREPEIIAGGDPATGAPDPDRLAQMMRDPRYWRDRDKDFVARVTDGYRRLYGG
ncbi:MAG TPA: hypothetical protein VNS22_04645 [Geminicoccus sp.]|uniref:capsid assembly protein n=1 Tax=Geminicoccus sp. TaxID=2024832 RepID=UPI002C43066C|nr:hypothetical protein [Geminicoccus sp.]HWL67655.1 hypothetical protein [Geminicoccus sp.]